MCSFDGRTWTRTYLKIVVSMNAWFAGRQNVSTEDKQNANLQGKSCIKLISFMQPASINTLLKRF
jgi:hypothetical protein